MAAGGEVTGEAAMAALLAQSTSGLDSANVNANVSAENNAETVTAVGRESDPRSEFQMQAMLEMLDKLSLNPRAAEFVPSSYLHDPNPDQFNSPPATEQLGILGVPNYRRRRNNYYNGSRRFHGRAFRAQREDSIRRTVYVSEIDLTVTEEQLAALFGSTCGQVVDCRICGDPRTPLRFAFVEFADERSAREALNLSGTVIGFYHVKVMPSKTAILPVNPTFLPRSEDEREMCARTVYCTNIDNHITQADLKYFFESCCGEVSRMRLLGDNVHSTRIAFVEFAVAESAIEALNCCGTLFGNYPIRVSPSKTPIRLRVPPPQYIN